MERVPGVRRLFRLGGRRAAEREIDDELAFHLDTRAAELAAARGLAPEAAREAALREFGDVAEARAELGTIDRLRHRRAERAEWWDAARLELRQGARALLRQPGLVAVVSFTLALGVGANAAIFGVLDRLMLSAPPHVADAGRVHQIHFDEQRAEVRGANVSASVSANARITWVRGSFPAYERIRADARAFERVAAYLRTTATLGVGAGVRQLDAVLATGGYFELLGARPALGRFFGEGDDAPPAGAPVAVVSNAFWRSELAADPAALGREIHVDGAPYTVVGVAPAGFTGAELVATDVWLPIRAAMAGDTTSAGEPWDRQRAQRIVFVLGRLRAGADSAVALAEATLAYRAAMAGAPNADSTAKAVFRSLIPGRSGDNLSSQQGKVAFWLQGVAGAALLIAVANVANLLILRAARRRRETAVRLALGAGRGRLVGRALLEGMMLSVVAGAAALAIGAWGGRLLRLLLLPDMARPDGPALDARAAAVTVAITLVVGLLTGLVPALARDTAAPSLAADLRGGARDGGGRRSSLRSGLVVAQVALSTALLVGAGLFVRSLHALRALDLGMDADRVLVARVDVDAAGITGANAEAFYDRARERVATLPGVAGAAVGLSVPFSPSLTRPISVPGLDAIPGTGPDGWGFPTFYAISPGYLATLGTRLIRGRDFTATDRVGAPPVMLVDETIARLFWPGQEALGKCIRVGGDTAPCSTVVGVVENTRRILTEARPAMRYYIPAAQSGWRNPPRHLFVRVAGGRRPEELIAAVRREVGSLAPNLGFVSVRPLQELVDRGARPWQLGSTMFTLLGALALVIASVGLYGALAYAVAQRTREIGIRMAIGARPGTVVRQVMGEGLRAASLGLAVGGALALVAGRWLAPLLFQTSPRDPLVFAGVAVALTAVATLASLAPAWRASRVEPTVALRTE